MILTLPQVITFALVLTRMSVMILMSPVFSNKEVFSVGKIIILFWMSTLIIFYIPLPIDFPKTPIALVAALLVEVVIGALLGYISQLLIEGIQFAGNLMDTQAGLSVASILDPSSGQTTTIISKIMKQIGLLVFLLIDGHHILLGVLIQSFRAVPVGAPFNLARASEHVAKSGILVFEIAIQLAAPIILVVFLIDFGFGMLSRVAPQVNVFQLGFQLKPIVSLFVFLTLIPGLVDLIYYLLEKISARLLEVLLLLRV